MILSLFGFCALSLCLSVGGREGELSVLSLRQEETGRIGIYLAMHSLTGDCPAAILMEISAPDGCRWQDVSAGEGAEGMILTHGDLGNETIKILLDGIFEGDSGSPLLWLWLDSPLGLGEQVTVTGEGGGELFLYILRKGGQVERIPLSVVWEGENTLETTETAETAEETVEDETGGASETTDTQGRTESNTAPDSVCPLPTDPDPSPVATFLGCRETGVTEGTYAVQFLFGGEGEGTPVLCMEGGGILSLSCGIMAGVCSKAQSPGQSRAFSSFHDPPGWGLQGLPTDQGLWEAGGSGLGYCSPPVP